MTEEKVDKKEKIKTPLKKIKVTKLQSQEKQGAKNVKAQGKPAETKGKKTTKTAISDTTKANFAVIRTGGKQYIVHVGEKHKFEKLIAKEGEVIKFNDVLLVKRGEKVDIGMPNVSGATVEAKVISQTKGDKITVLKYKKRKNYRRKQGHRQKLTEVEILKV